MSETLRVGVGTLRRGSSGLLKAPRFVVLAMLVAASLGCGGGGGGGGGGSTPTQPPPQPPPPPPAQSGVTFTGNTPPPGNSVTLQQGAGTDTDTLVLDLQATSLNGTFALGFDLVFPGALLEFVGATEGPAFAADGAQTSFLVTEDGGQLLVGVARLDNGNFTGSGLLASFEFNAVANGSGQIFFDREEALDSAGDELNLIWDGGSVQISP